MQSYNKMQKHKWLEFTPQADISEMVKLFSKFTEDENGDMIQSDLIIDGDSHTVFVPDATYYMNLK